MATVFWKVLMNRFTRRTLAAVSATAFAAAGIALAAPATASAGPVIKTAPNAKYVSFSDIHEDHFAAIDTVADQINDFLPGDEEVVFVANKRGPRSAIGIWDRARTPGNTLMVECDPETDTWSSYLAGSCSGNEESLLP